MPIVEYSLEDGKELTPDEEEAARIRIQKAVSSQRISNAPQLSDKQLSEFMPVNFATMEERADAMKAAGLIDSDGNLVVREQAACV